MLEATRYRPVQIDFRFDIKRDRKPGEWSFEAALDLAAMIQYTYHFCVIGLIAQGVNMDQDRMREALNEAYSGLSIDLGELSRWKAGGDASASHRLMYESFVRRFVHQGLSHVANIEDDFISLVQIRKRSPLTVGYVVPDFLATPIIVAASALTGVGVSTLINFGTKQIARLAEVAKTLSERSVNLSTADLNKAQALAYPAKASAEVEKMLAEAELARAQVRKIDSELEKDRQRERAKRRRVADEG